MKENDVVNTHGIISNKLREVLSINDKLACSLVRVNIEETSEEATYDIRAKFVLNRKTETKVDG